MDTVEVRWIDAEACEDDRWTPVDEAIKYAAEPIKECSTVGYILPGSTDTHISLGQTDGGDVIGTIWKIPRGCIVSDSTGRPYVRSLVVGEFYDI